MKSLQSTRVLIPVCLLVLVTTALSLDYVTSARLDKRQILDSRTLTLKNTLNYVQSSTELFLSMSSNSQIQQAISSFAAEKDIVVLFITDPAGNIIAATDIQSIGKHWSQIDRSPTPLMVS